MNIYLHKAQSLLQKYSALDLSKEPLEVGVDEAGRGPVLGPLVFGSVAWPIKLKNQLGQLGFNDSKKLDEKKRESLMEVIELLNDKLLYRDSISLGPEYISNKMLARRPTNLNTLSHESAFALIRGFLKRGLLVKEAYLDTVGPAQSYTRILQQQFRDFPGVSFKVTPKADSLFKVVSASSICAKVRRDRQIQSWKFQEGDISRQYGSGYPADPNTVRWLDSNQDQVFGFPKFVRFSWETIKSRLRERGTKMGTSGGGHSTLIQQIFKSSAW